MHWTTWKGSSDVKVAWLTPSVGHETCYPAHIKDNFAIEFNGRKIGPIGLEGQS